MKIDHRRPCLKMVLIEGCAYGAGVSHAHDCRNRHIKNSAGGSLTVLPCLEYNYLQSIQCPLMPTIQITSKTPYLLYWKLVFLGVLRDTIRPEPISVEGDPGMKIMIFDESCMND